MKIESWYFVFFISFGLISCSGEKSDDEIVSEKQDLNIKQEFEEKYIKSLIFNKMKIEESDLGSFEMHKAHLNADAEEDGYVVLDLAPKAKRDMENSSNPARFHDAGYIGDYNFIFVWDGKTKSLGTAFKLVGNGLIPLKVSATNFLNPGYKSLSAEYRVQNSTFETFFSNVNGQLLPVFSYTKANLIGTQEMTIQTHKFQENKDQVEKDILVVQGELSGYNPTEAALNKNTYDVGQIVPTNTLVHHFFFDEQSRKYATLEAK